MSPTMFPVLLIAASRVFISLVFSLIVSFTLTLYRTSQYHYFSLHRIPLQMSDAFTSSSFDTSSWGSSLPTGSSLRSTSSLLSDAVLPSSAFLPGPIERQQLQPVGSLPPPPVTALSLPGPPQSSTHTSLASQSPPTLDCRCPVATCQYSVKPGSASVRQNLIRHIKTMRKAEELTPNAPQPHLHLSPEIIGYRPRMSHQELERLSVEEGAKRRKESRNERPRIRRQLSKEQAREQAALHGDVTHWRRYDKTAEYSRMAATKRRLEETYTFSHTNVVLASDEMGGLFCFYLDFSLCVTVTEDLDQLPNGVPTLVEHLRTAYPDEHGEGFRTVGAIIWNHRICNYH
jgi:hypothetical protein